MLALLQPEERWRDYVINLVDLNVGALAGSFGADAFPHGLGSTSAHRSRTMDGIGAVLQVAHQGDLVSSDVTVPRFLLGILQFTRPLPSGAPDELTGELDWLLDTYLSGIRPPRV